MNDIGFFGMMDETISYSLETTPEEYTRVIEEKCSYSKENLLSYLYYQVEKIR